MAVLSGSFVLLLVPAFAASGSQADQPQKTEMQPTNAQPTLEQSTASGVPADAEAIALDLGLPAPLVEQQLVYQEQMRQIDFRALDGGYAAISSNLGEAFRITYATKGKTPARVVAALKAAGLLEFASFKTVPSTEAELAVAQKRVNERIKEQGIKADTSTDPFTGVVEVFTAEALAREVRNDLTAVTGGVPVDWQVKPLAVPAASYGGYGMTSCTAGFVVVNLSTNGRGVLTAGHCDNTQSYPHVGGALNFQTQYWAGSGDIQWHIKAGVTWGARVFDGSGTRAINGLRNTAQMNFGDPVAKYGKTTGFTTGVIVDKTFCPSYVPACQGTFILANANSGPMSDNGDSGGPVMLNNVAYGTVSGSMNNNVTLIYAAQQYTQSLLNVKVLTQ